MAPTRGVSINDNGNLASLPMHAVNDTDSGFESELDSMFTGRYWNQGMSAVKDSDKFIRFDSCKYKAGSTKRVFAGAIVNGNPVQQMKAYIASGIAPKYPCVSRVWVSGRSHIPFMG